MPTSAHVEVGLAVLERGIHALIEKPLADALSGGEQLVHTARERGLCLQVGHVERFNRAVRAAAPYLEEPRFLRRDADGAGVERADAHHDAAARHERRRRKIVLFGGPLTTQPTPNTPITPYTTPQPPPPTTGVPTN